MGAATAVDGAMHVDTAARPQPGQAATSKSRGYADRERAVEALGQMVAGGYRLTIDPERREVRIADRGAVVRYRIEIGTRSGGRQTSAYGWYERIREANGDRCETAVSVADVMAVCREVASVDQVVKAVARQFKVSRGDILEGRRWPRGALERQVALYVADQVAALDRRELAQRFGARGSSNVEQACRRVIAAMNSDARLGRSIRELCDELAAGMVGRSEEVVAITEAAADELERKAAEQAALPLAKRSHQPYHLRQLAERLRAEIEDGRDYKRLGTRRLQAAVLERIVRGDTVAMMCERGGFMMSNGGPDTSWLQRRAGLVPTQVDKHGKKRCARTAAYEHYVMLVKAVAGDYREWGI